MIVSWGLILRQVKAIDKYSWKDGLLSINQFFFPDNVTDGVHTDFSGNVYIYIYIYIYI